jgi:hypothetical protein
MAWSLVRWRHCQDRAGYGARGGITMALRIIMSSRIVRFVGLLPGWVPRGAD